MAITNEQKRGIIHACNQRDIRTVYTERIFVDGLAYAMVRVIFYSGTYSSIMRLDADKEEVDALILRIYQIKENNLMEKYDKILNEPI